MKKKIGLACALLHAPAAAGAGRAVRGGRPGLGRADPRHPAPVCRRRRHGDLLQPRDGGGGAALHARGDPGRAARSSAVGTLDEVRGGRDLEDVFVEVVGGRTATGRSCRGCDRDRGRRRRLAPGRRSARHFVRLKLRLMRNGFRGQAWRVVAVRASACCSGSGSPPAVLPASPRHGLAGDGDVAVLVAAFGGAAAGARLAAGAAGLLRRGRDARPGPVRAAADAAAHAGHRPARGRPRRRAGAGHAARHVRAGVAAGIRSAAGRRRWSPSSGVLAGLLLCVAASRAVTSAFATMLRSRRVRDLAAVLLAVLAALLGPLQLVGLAALQRGRLGPADRGGAVVGWTPFGAPWTRRHRRGRGAGVGGAGQAADHGGRRSAPCWLVVPVAGVGDGGRGERRQGPGAARQSTGGAVAQLFPRAAGWARRDRFGALVAREAVTGGGTRAGGPT